MRAPLQGTVVAIDVAEGDLVHAGAQLLVMEAMKMEHVVPAPASGVVRRIGVALGDAVLEGHPIVAIEPCDLGTTVEHDAQDVDLDRVRPDLAEVIERHAFGLDAARPDAVARRRGDRPAHRARERRGPLRSRLVRRVRLAGDRGAAPPARRSTT